MLNSENRAVIMTLLLSVFLAFLLVDGKTAYNLQATNDELADNAAGELDEITNVGKYTMYTEKY